MGAKKQNKTLSTQESHKARCMSANSIVGVGCCVTARMRHETTGQCSAVLAGHLINEATQGENTLAAINCSLLITCMCQDV